MRYPSHEEIEDKTIEYLDNGGEITILEPEKAPVIIQRIGEDSFGHIEQMTDNFNFILGGFAQSKKK